MVFAPAKKVRNFPARDFQKLEHDEHPASFDVGCEINGGAYVLA